jgi:integrase
MAPAGGFTFEQVVALTTDARIPEDRRTMYGLRFLGGARPGEAANARWRDLDRSRDGDTCLRDRLEHLRRAAQQSLFPARSNAPVCRGVFIFSRRMCPTCARDTASGDGRLAS